MGLYDCVEGGSDWRPRSGEPWLLYERGGEPAEKPCVSDGREVVLPAYRLRSGDDWRRKGANSARGPDSRLRRGEGGCMLWVLDGAFAGGDGWGCDVCAAAPVSPAPMRDEMDMLLPGRAWPSPGSSLLTPKVAV